ncbi:Uncharacterised protein [uncultured archaeon]|nr:Uncharacterised protein [uncultured archaeon]
MKREKFFKTHIGVFLLGAFVGTLAPSPVDPIYFYLENYVVPHLTGIGKVGLQIFDWYILDALWYLALMGIAFILHIKEVNVAKKITVIGGIAGLGIVIGIISKIALG